MAPVRAETFIVFSPRSFSGGMLMEAPGEPGEQLIQVQRALTIPKRSGG
jgi:hypothetical protein